MSDVINAGTAKAMSRYVGTLSVSNKTFLIIEAGDKNFIHLLPYFQEHVSDHVACFQSRTHHIKLIAMG